MQTVATIRAMPVPAIRALLLPTWIAVFTGASANAQTLDDVRDRLSAGLRETAFARSLTGLVQLTEELEFSGAQYTLDDDHNTRLTTYALPFHTDLEVLGPDGPELHVEGSLGYAEAKQRVTDLYDGGLPGSETAVSLRWRTYGAIVGAGLRFDITDDLAVTPLVDFGVIELENKARYSGPGAAGSAAVFDGIAFNWDATALTFGTGLRTDWTKPLDDEHTLELIGRYDLRWTDTVSVDDPAQEFSSDSQMLTLRADVTGPTGWEPWGQPLGWRATTGYRHFFDEELFDTDDYFEIGGSLELGTGDGLPFAKGLTLAGALIFGDDITGWTLGLGLTF